MKEFFNKVADFFKTAYEKTAEFIKVSYDNVVAYCTENTQQAIIIGGAALAVIILLIVLIVCGAKRKKKKNAIAKETAQETALPVNAESSIPIVTPFPVTYETATPIVEETKAEEIKPEITPVENTEPVKAEPAKVETVKAEPVKAEKAPAKKTAKAEPAKTTKAPTVKKEVPPAETPSTTLHDALKDVNEDANFYVEDGADQEAKYRGKWVFCRLVTDDKDPEEMYFFELRASNGEKLLTSEEYTSYNGAIRGIQTHKNNIAKGNFRITISKRGEYIFKLLSGKNMLLCMGESYTSKARCEAAIASTKRFAETAVIDENVQYQVIKVPVEDDTPIEPLKDGCKGKWIIDCMEISENEKVYTFELFANNGERLLSSEEYTTYIGAVNGIQTHKQNIEKGNFRIVLTKRGDYIYKLLNSNGQLLCLGEHYKTKRLCQNAVESVNRFAMSSPVLTDSKIKK